MIPKLGSICMLCQRHPPIQNSHLWPKFVVNWVKQTTSPYLRKGDNPNRRLQDVTTFPILCTDCEGLFSKFENQFKLKIYKPFREDYDNQIASFRYGRWLAQFVISISWRTLVVDFANYEKRAPSQVHFAEKAYEHWRKYLLGTSRKIRPYGHHMFFFSYIDISTSTVSDIPENLHRYVHSGFDAEICFDTKPIVYTLIPGIAFWSPLKPGDDKNWSNAIVDRGTLLVGQSVQDGRFYQIMKESAELAFSRDLSPRQKEKVNADCQRLMEEKSPEEWTRIMAPLRHDQLVKRLKRQP